MLEQLCAIEAPRGNVLSEAVLFAYSNTFGTAQFVTVRSCDTAPTRP